MLSLLILKVVDCFNNIGYPKMVGGTNSRITKWFVKRPPRYFSNGVYEMSTVIKMTTLGRLLL